MTVAAALLVGGARHLACLRVRWLGWFGTISYGLYLWSGLLLRAGWNVPLTMCASVGLAAASWYAVERRFVERPAASGATLPVRQNKGSSGRSDGAGDTDTSEGGRLMSSRRGTASPADATPTA